MKTSCAPGRPGKGTHLDLWLEARTLSNAGYKSDTRCSQYARAMKKWSELRDEMLKQPERAARIEAAAAELRAELEKPSPPPRPR